METQEAPIPIMFVDEAATFGGTIVVLATLIGELDRSAFVPILVSSMQPRIFKSLFNSNEVLIPLRCSFDYVKRARVIAFFRDINERFARLGAYAATVLGMPADIIYRRRLLKIIQRYQPALVHISNNSHRAARVCAKLGKPFIWHLHAPSSIASPQARNEPLTRANAAIAISNYVVHHSPDLDVIPGPRFVIPNPTRAVAKAPPEKLIALRNKLGIGANQPIVGIFGRLVAWKGQKEFIEAFRIVLRDCPNAVALVVGDASDLGHEYEKEIRSLIERESLSQNVRLYGYSADPAPLYQLCSIVVHASVEPEPFGLVIIEAMTAGSAVIASSLGAGPEIVMHERSGLIADPRNTAELAAAILRLMRDEELRTRLAATGQQIASTEYSATRYARAVENLYRTVLQPVPRRVGARTSETAQDADKLDAA